MLEAWSRHAFAPQHCALPEVRAIPTGSSHEMANDVILLKRPKEPREPVRDLLIDPSRCCVVTVAFLGEQPVEPRYDVLRQNRRSRPACALERHDAFV